MKKKVNDKKEIKIQKTNNDDKQDLKEIINEQENILFKNVQDMNLLCSMLNKHLINFLLSKNPYFKGNTKNITEENLLKIKEKLFPLNIDDLNSISLFLLELHLLDGESKFTLFLLKQIKENLLI